jgi:hypothetical protein
LTKFGKGDIMKMTAEQYNNVVKCTMKREEFPKDADSFEQARAIFKNLGVALPQGAGRQVLDLLQTDDYMGWRSCTAQEAQQYANKGVAAIGVGEDRMVILAAVTEENEIEETVAAKTPMVMTLQEDAITDVAPDLSFYAYSYGATTTQSSTDTTESVDQYRDVYTYELVHMFGFSQSTALLIRSLYDKMDQKFPSDSKLERAWKCARLLGGIEYGNENESIFMQTLWKQFAGEVCSIGEEQAYFITTLGYTLEEYDQLTIDIHSQHNNSTTSDFVHMQMALATRLAYLLNKQKILADVAAVFVEEDAAYVGGWLGDTSLARVGFEPSMRNADYCADLDAENLYHFIFDKGNSISGFNYYFSTVPHTYVTRIDLFLIYLSYDFVQQKVFWYLGVKNEEDPMGIIKQRYPDTYNFLCSIRDRRSTMAEYE